MKKLFIIADDFGISKGVNKAIFECCEHNILTGVSVMTTGAAFEDILILKEKYPQIEIGLHFDLFSRKLLTDLNLDFTPAQLAFRLMYDNNLLQKIGRELLAQVRKLLEFTKITHIDSHRHIHYIPKIFRFVNEIADEYAVNRVRIPCPRLRLNGLKYVLNRNDFLKFFPFFIWKYFNETNASSTDDFFGLFQVGNLSENYLNYIFECDFEYAELMVHPGYVDETLKKTNENLLYKREAELKLLIDFFTRKFREDKFIDSVIHGGK